MPQSELRLINRSAEFIEKEELFSLPRKVRGIYVLYKHRGGREAGKFDVVYVGMAAAGRQGGLRQRLMVHRRKKGDLWTHFSVFEVWDNIRDEEIRELEGLFRHLYRKDTRANRLNVQRGFKKMRRIREDNLNLWKDDPRSRVRPARDR
jgi:hypothetical protein